MQIKSMFYGSMIEKPNGAYCGDIHKDDDETFIAEIDQAKLTAPELRAIADKLDELNGVKL